MPYHTWSDQTAKLVQAAAGEDTARRMINNHADFLKNDIPLASRSLSHRLDMGTRLPQRNTAYPRLGGARLPELCQRYRLYGSPGSRVSLRFSMARLQIREPAALRLYDVQRRHVKIGRWNGLGPGFGTWSRP
jgi:hypothetical protein